MISISIIQFAPKLAHTMSNIETIHAYLDSVQSDIIVFPELATSGYFFTDSISLAPHAMEWNKHKDLLEIQKRASAEKRIIVLGFPELTNEGIYNSAGIFMPKAQESKVYRKTHLFSKEKYCFLPGNTGFFTVHEQNMDIRLGIMICYDWRFPESARTLALQGADAIICPANLVTTLSGKVFPARAIENKVYMIVANRIGIEQNAEEELLFRGESAIYDYSGDILAKASLEHEEVLYAMISPEKSRVKSFNSENDIFLDRRPDMYA